MESKRPSDGDLITKVNGWESRTLANHSNRGAHLALDYDYG